MAGFQNFRSAFNGFRREDVVHYIEYMNNKHASQIEQLNSQILSLQAELSQAKSASSTNAQLESALDDAKARIAELEEALTFCGNEQGASASKAEPTAEELEAYRRAERTERLARERASQIYAQANAILADAAVKVDTAFSEIEKIGDGMTVLLQEYQSTVDNTKSTLKDTVAAIYAIRPED